MKFSYIPAEEIACWLPFSSSPFFIEDYFGNQALFPNTIPNTNEYRLLDLAILRAALRQSLNQSSTKEVNGTGDKGVLSQSLVLPDLVTVENEGIIIEPHIFHYAKNAREAVLVALDGLEPSTTQFFRRQGNSTVYLGLALCIEGELHGNEDMAHDALTVQFITGEKQTVPLKPDTLHWVAGQSGKEAQIEFSFSKATLNRKQKGNMSVVFGEIGMVVDTRGRPFAKPQPTDQGKARVSAWIKTIEDEQPRGEKSA